MSHRDNGMDHTHDQLHTALERERQAPMPKPYSNPPRRYDDEIAQLREMAATSAEGEDA